MRGRSWPGVSRVAERYSRASTLAASNRSEVSARVPAAIARAACQDTVPSRSPVRTQGSRVHRSCASPIRCPAVTGATRSSAASWSAANSSTHALPAAPNRTGRASPGRFGFLSGSVWVGAATSWPAANAQIPRASSEADHASSRFAASR
jgi:hypothetical protein